MKKALKIGAIGLVIFWIINSPQQAANTAENIGGKLQNGATSVTTFTSNLTDGR